MYKVRRHTKCSIVQKIPAQAAASHNAKLWIIDETQNRLTQCQSQRLFKHGSCTVSRSCDSRPDRHTRRGLNGPASRSAHRSDETTQKIFIKKRIRQQNWEGWIREWKLWRKNNRIAITGTSSRTLDARDAKCPTNSSGRFSSAASPAHSRGQEASMVSAVRAVDFIFLGRRRRPAQTESPARSRPPRLPSAHVEARASNFQHSFLASVCSAIEWGSASLPSSH